MRAIIGLVATLPLLAAPLALCTLVKCPMLVTAPTEQAKTSCCQHDAATVVSSPCQSQDDSPVQPRHCSLTATERYLARPTATSTAPELAPLRIASATTLTELEPEATRATQSSPTLPLKRQFDPIVARGPRAPPPGDIAPSDWV